MAQARMIYGFHAIFAALAHQPENILTLYCQEKESGPRVAEFLSKAAAAGLTVQSLSRTKLEQLTQSTHHQGVAATIRARSAMAEQDVLQWLEKTSKKPLLLLLEGLQDPHNLGACLRSAESLGVDWVILPKLHTAPLNATVSKVACGADQSLAIAMVTNLVRFIGQIQQQGVWVVGTSLATEKNLNCVDFTRSTAIVMGAEEKGLKHLTLNSCDELVKIPLQGTVASLNVSVATGICLYECVRQRQA